jgi:hypothetical protein
MSNLSNQPINNSFVGLLQVPGGITSTLQTVQDGEGNPTGLQISSTGSNVSTSSTFVASNSGVAYTGTVPRQISDGFGDFVSVKDFGAVGDGVANDTAAFAAAIAASKYVFVPVGTYLVDSIVISDITESGRTFVGASTTETIIKGTTTATNLFSVIGVIGSGYNQYNTFKNFTLDMSLMPNNSSSKGIYTYLTYGNSFKNVNVKNSGSAARSLYLDNKTYTTVFDNCDFGPLTGVVQMQGVSLSDAVTTITFIGCSFGQMIADQVVSITLLQPIVQGALNKFVLSNATGFSILHGDIEGTGTYLVLSGTVQRLWSFGNEFTGYSGGSYKTGTYNDGALMDIYAVPFELSPQEPYGTVHTGLITEQVSTAITSRKLLQNTSGTPAAVDLECKNSLGSSLIGNSVAGNAYIDNRIAGGKVSLQQIGVDKVGVSGANLLIVGTATATTATAGTFGAPPAQVKGYLRFVNSAGTEVGKIPYYEL